MELIASSVRCAAASGNGSGPAFGAKGVEKNKPTLSVR
jgi:hypothetical protein